MFMKPVSLVNRINAFARLGDILRNPDPDRFRMLTVEIQQLNDLIDNSHHDNAWFTPEMVRLALHATGQSLKTAKIEKWIGNYPIKKLEHCKPKTIGIVMAGNIPMVGFHDYLSALISGHKLVAKLSSGDSKLLPLMHRIISKIEPALQPMVHFTQSPLKGFDAIIATGSNNTSRYFDYYFGKYPNIIRKNRNSLALLTGKETDEQLHALGADIFSYFGLGCRNVSKLLTPKNYNFDRFFDHIQDHVEVINHHKYKNNYDYNKAIMLVNSVPHLDNGFLLLREDTAFSSPVGVINYERDDTIANARQRIENNLEDLQCVVSVANLSPIKAISPGKSQQPELWDYADNIDTIEFLAGLK